MSRRGHDTFTLRLPFRLEQTHPLLGVNEHPPTVYDGLDVRITTNPLRNDSPSYWMLIAGFPSAESAAQFLPRAWAGLTSLMLRYGAAYTTTLVLTEGDLLSSVDAPVIYQTDKTLRIYAGGSPTVTIPTPAHLALDAMTEGFDSASAVEQFGDVDFRSAVELYAATLGGSGAAQLLLLSSALEMLAPRPARHVAALELLKSWGNEITTALAEWAHDADASFDLEALRDGLKFLEHRAIRVSLRKYVLAELSGAADADVMARKAVLAWDSGSLIRHGSGKKVKADTRSAAIADLRAILKRIFARRLFLTPT